MIHARCFSLLESMFVLFIHLVVSEAELVQVPHVDW